VERLHSQPNKFDHIHTSLVPIDLGYSLNARSGGDRLVFYLVSQKAAFKILRFAKKYKTSVNVITTVWACTCTFLYYVAYFDFDFPGRDALLLFSMIFSPLSLFFTLVLGMRVVLFTKVMAKFQFWFILANALLLELSFWFSLPGVNLLCKVYLSILFPIRYCYVLCADATIIPKIAKTVVALIAAISAVNVIVLPLLREGLWRGIEDEVINQSLGWVGNYWCVHFFFEHYVDHIHHTNINSCVLNYPLVGIQFLL
jgi:hypothetical protein